MGENTAPRVVIQKSNGQLGVASYLKLQELTREAGLQIPAPEDGIIDWNTHINNVAEDEHGHLWKNISQKIGHHPSS